MKLLRRLLNRNNDVPRLPSAAATAVDQAEHAIQQRLARYTHDSEDGDGGALDRWASARERAMPFLGSGERAATASSWD